MTDQERHLLLQAVKDYIVADPDVAFGPILIDSQPDRPGIWIQVGNHDAYLGKTFAAAMLTAREADWWIPDRDGNLLPDDMQWFEERAQLGDSWQEKELPMFKAERRTRKTNNISLATDPDP